MRSATAEGAQPCHTHAVRRPPAQPAPETATTCPKLSSGEYGCVANTLPTANSNATWTTVSESDTSEDRASADASSESGAVHHLHKKRHQKAMAATALPSSSLAEATAAFQETLRARATTLENVLTVSSPYITDPAASDISWHFSDALATVSYVPDGVRQQR